MVGGVADKAGSDDDAGSADTDVVLSGSAVLGEVRANRSYAVFSTTTDNRQALSFIFLLPLTALAWKRVRCLYSIAQTTRGGSQWITKCMGVRT